VNRFVSVVLPVVLLVGTVGLLALAGIGAVRITGDSMRPALRVGDVAVYRRGQPVGVGDVVVYRDGGSSLVVHRISALEKSGDVRTRGDANTIMDRDPLDAANIEGRVLFVLPTGWAARVDLPLRGATLLSQLDSRL